MDSLKKIAALIGLLFISAAYSQYKPELLTIQDKINTGNNTEALNDLDEIEKDKLSPPNKAFYMYLKASCFYNTNQGAKAFSSYLAAKKLYKECDSLDKANDINLDIAFLIRAQNDRKNTYYNYVSEYINYAVKKDDLAKLSRGYGYLAMFKADEKKYNDALYYYKKALSHVKNTDDKTLESALNNNLANLYNENLKMPDSGLYYLKKDLLIIKDNGSSEDLYHNYVNQASSYHHKGDYSTSNNYLKKADSLLLKNHPMLSKQLLYEGYYKNYEELKDYSNAYKYLTLSKQLEDSAKTEEQNIAINDIQTKYRTKEKELENNNLKNKNRTNTILLYTFIVLLLASVIIGWLIIKNARRREKISNQEKLIEQQKLEKVLKDYELHSIDIMLEGQEKERQRIANDLHDNLGSMLATLKINFENLKLRKNGLRDDEVRLYEKTDELIGEAYQKVRRLAHAKSAGVFANEGLIPAIKKLARKVSVPGKLNIQVVAFGFNDRLENPVEISIFRIIQELTTNIVKHSQATEATIHLTHHEDNINLIVEDNGIGFEKEKKGNSDGMGLGSIQKKVIQLGGEFNIDTTPGNGTTIIIDLPI